MHPAQRPAGHQAPAQAASYLVANQGAGYRGEDYDQHQQRQRDPAAAGQHAAEDHGGLAGQDEAEEQRGLTENKARDGHIGDQTAEMNQVTGYRVHSGLPLSAVGRGLGAMLGRAVPGFGTARGFAGRPDSRRGG